MGKFRKKPVIVEAVQFTGTNHVEIFTWMGVNCLPVFSEDTVYISTLDGVIYAHKGDWIVRGVADELFSCRSDKFEELYEPVE